MGNEQHSLLTINKRGKKKGNKIIIRQTPQMRWGCRWDPPIDLFHPLKLVGESLRSNKIRTSSNYLLQNIYQLQKYSNFTVEKCHLKQVMKVNTNNTNQYHEPLDMMHQAHIMIFIVFAKNVSSHSNHKKVSDKVNWGAFYKITDQFSSKI